MSGYAETLKAILFATRAIPGNMGLRPFTVAVRTGAWNGSNTGRGAEAVDFTPLLEGNGQNPKVRQLNTEELALAGLGKGSVKIGPITPDFPGGGTKISVFGEELAKGETLNLLITGPGTKECGDLFLIKSLNTDHALHWTIVAEPVQ